MIRVEQSATPPPTWKRLRAFFLVANFPIVLALLFYGVENYRGQRVWKAYAAELKRLGQKVELKDFAPPPVPDDENVFKAPRMEEWFGRRGPSDFARRLGSFSPRDYGPVLAEMTVAMIGESFDPEKTDLVWRYRHHSLSLIPSETSRERSPFVIPLILFSGVPLTVAIENLARQAGLQVAIASNVLSSTSGLEPVISVRWEKITAEEALVGLLETYNLQINLDPQLGIARISAKPDPAAPIVYSPDDVRREAKAAFQRVASLVTNSPGRHATGSMGFQFIAQRPAPFKPVRVLVQAEQSPALSEIEELIPESTRALFPSSYGRLRARPAGSNTYHLRFENPCAAADYLTWSDQFETEFNVIRTALQRPVVQLEFDYQSADKAPTANFILHRYLAQTLSQRAQCHLLLNQSDAALRDLTLLHDCRRLLEGQPITLVATMINTAITGLYADVVGEGLRLHAWRELDLVTLQKQLGEINLSPCLTAGLKYERASLLPLFEPGRLIESEALLNSINTGSVVTPTNIWQKWKHPVFRFYTLAPHGWVQQNLTTATRTFQGLIDAQNTNRLVRPGEINKAADYIETVKKSSSPYAFLMNAALPNFRRGTASTTQTQIKVREAFTACALERYRLVRHEYPESLDLLVPEFAETVSKDIGDQPLKYRRTDAQKFMLYSVGWNETDDGGQTVPGLENGDWVWQFAAN